MVLFMQLPNQNNSYASTSDLGLAISGTTLKRQIHNCMN